MGNKKNIDRLFQEQFKTFHQEPKNEAWKHIKNNLEASKSTKKKRSIPFWMLLSGIAASIILLITVGITQFSTQKDSVPTSIVSPNNTTKPSIIKGKILISEQSDTKKSILSQRSSITIEGTKTTPNTNVSASKNSTFIYSKKKTVQQHDKSNIVLKDHTFDTHNAPQNTVAATSKNNTAIQTKKKTTSFKNDDHLNSGATNQEKSNIDKSKKTNNLTNHNIASNRKNTQSISHKDQILSETIPNRLKNNITEQVAITTNQKSINNSIHQDITKNNPNYQSNTFTSQNKNNTVTDSTSSDKNTKNLFTNPNIDILENTIKTTFNDSIATNSITEEEIIAEENIEENKTAITEAIAEQELKKETTEDDEIAQQNYTKWDISTNIAPVYYNTLSNGSPIDNQFSSNKKKGQINTSYGVNVSYALNKKFSIRTGVHKLELGYDTQDVAVLPVSNASGGGGYVGLKGLNATPGVNLNISNENSFSVSQIPDGFSSLFDSSLNQRLGYIEVPLEIGYQISDKKTKIKVNAGISAFFLNKNEIYSETNETQTYLGSGNNLNQTSFSTNIGIGFNFNLSKHLNFNLEPSFKYQLNAFNKDAGNFKPYILGVYTGFSFKF